MTQRMKIFGDVVAVSHNFLVPTLASTYVFNILKPYYVLFLKEGYLVLLVYLIKMNQRYLS